MNYEIQGEQSQNLAPAPELSAPEVAVFEQHQSIMDRLGNTKIGVGIAIAAASVALATTNAKEVFARGGSDEAPQAQIGSYNVQSSSLAIKGFKKCRKGKPAFQTRLIGPTPIEKDGRAKNVYKSEVPSIDTPVKYEVQAKSCKSRKRVRFDMHSGRDDYSKRFNMKAGKVKSLFYELVFTPPDSDVNNIHRKNSRRVIFSLSQKRKGLGGAMIGYYYSDSQLQPAQPASTPTESTGPTGPTQ